MMRMCLKLVFIKCIVNCNTVSLFRVLVPIWHCLQCPANASPVVALVTDVCNSCGTNQVNPHALIYEQHLSQDYQVDVHVEQVT